MAKHICISFCVMTLLLLAGCRSSHNAVKDDGYAESLEKIADADRRAIVKEAHSWLGTKYRYGGSDRSGVDCSGMVMQIYLKVANVKLPRNSAQQQQYCRKIKRKNLEEGDLVFFATGRDKTRVSHVGIYIGKDKMIHASSSSGVIESSLDDKYYIRHYHSSGSVDAVFARNDSKKQASNKKAIAPQPVAEVSVENLNQIMAQDSVMSFSPEVTQQYDSIYSSWLE